MLLLSIVHFVVGHLISVLPHMQYLDPLAAEVGYHFGTVKEQHGIKACMHNTPHFFSLKNLNLPESS